MNQHRPLTRHLLARKDAEEEGGRLLGTSASLNDPLFSLKAATILVGLLLVWRYT